MKPNAELEVRVSQALPQWQNARFQVRVSVITTLITGSITANVMRELTPLWSVFRGQFYPWNPAQFAVEKESEVLVRRILAVSLKKTRISSWEIQKSETLLTTCWVQVCSYLKSLWDFCWIEAVLLLPPSKEKIPKISWRLPGQRKTRFTFHRHSKNPTLNKEKIWAWTSSLSYNRDFLRLL